MSQIMFPMCYLLRTFLLLIATRVPQRALKYLRPWAPDPSDPSPGALWMQFLRANTRVCTNAGCLVSCLPVLRASGRDL